MGTPASFDALSTIVEHYESCGRSIRHVEATAGDDGETLDVTVESVVSLCAASGDGLSQQLARADASVTDDGTVRIEFSESVLTALPSMSTAVTVSDRSVRVADEGLLSVLELHIDPAGKADQAAVESDETTGDDQAAVDPDETTSDEPAEPHRRLLEHGQPDDVPEPAATDGSATSAGRPPAETESEPAIDLAAVRDDSLPPYEDTDYLQRLYEICENFTEMSRRIEMDVSSETVRRYMIDANVHTPRSYNTAESDEETTESVDSPVEPSTESSAESSVEPSTDSPVDPSTTQSPTPNDDPKDRIRDETLVTDGLGLPESIGVEDVADAVASSMTVYEVQRQLQLDRARTRMILEKLDLLDLVSRTVSGDPERSVSYDRIAGRIRQCDSSGG